MLESDSLRGRRITALALSAFMLALGATLGSAAAEPLGTLKERLSDKASDNQRVDNCHVPVERRGPKPRPECKPAVEQAPPGGRPKLGESATRYPPDGVPHTIAPDARRLHDPAHAEGPSPEEPAMPTYEYHCQKCGKIFERHEHIAEHEKSHPLCPKCRSGAVEPVLAGFYAKTSKKS